MKLKKNIATSEEGFVFNPGTGDSFTTNSTGTEVISLLKAETPFSEIIDKMCAKYDVDKHQLEKDLDDFMSQLKEAAIFG